MQSSSLMRGAGLVRGTPFRPANVSRSSAVQVSCNRKVQKKTRVVLTKDVPGVGSPGEIMLVPVGYWRNYLQPSRLANIASESLLSGIRKKKEAELRAKLEAGPARSSLLTNPPASQSVCLLACLSLSPADPACLSALLSDLEKAKAQGFANALAAIGKFVIKKKTGDKDQIYGSVQTSEIADAIYQQTGRSVADAEFTIPEIKSVGTFECNVRLHPEVTATFSVVIQKDKSLTIKAKPEASKKNAGCMTAVSAVSGRGGQSCARTAAVFPPRMV
ncbi:ribosomal_L9 domain-containing protein [Haematococcus lacustris]|uniref:Large ribosomal subunit protein bL9c n=1 Tax=Haematococcus lacustris TaxID=44745 RepID=A0A699YN27_HAELA|nr:ribosomal_L9 domain-containing protein [Haematococcus lacustris]